MGVSGGVEMRVYSYSGSVFTLYYGLHNDSPVSLGPFSLYYGLHNDSPYSRCGPVSFGPLSSQCLFASFQIRIRNQRLAADQIAWRDSYYYSSAVNGGGRG